MRLIHCDSRLDLHDDDLNEHPSHPGYRHAIDLSEIRAAIAAEDAYDVDGDKVLKLVGQKVTYQPFGGAVNTYQIDEGAYNYILVPCYNEVTEEEEAAALASILRSLP